MLKDMVMMCWEFQKLELQCVFYQELLDKLLNKERRMKRISKIFLMIALSIFLIKPVIAQAGWREEIIVDVDGMVMENIGTDNKEYSVEESIEISNRKVSGHYRIIPTLISTDYYFNLLKWNEIKVFKLIQSKFMASCSENFIEIITKGIIKK